MENPNPAVESTDYSVFIDTNLQTHLGLDVSNNDTVLQLKEKVMSAHFHCFPSLGKIDVDAIKIKRKKRFYHLSDSMCVKSLFGGVKGTRFLYVDVVSQVVSRDNPLHLEPSPCSQPNLLVDGPSAENLLNKDDIVLEKSLHEKPPRDAEHVKSAGLAVKQVESAVSEKGKKKKKKPSIGEEVNSTAESEETGVKRKLSDASLDTEVKDVVNARKKKMTNEISDGKSGLSSSRAGKDDSTTVEVPETSKREEASNADHPSQTKKSGKRLLPTGKSSKLKEKTIDAPSLCLDKGSDKDCGLRDNSENTPKKQEVVISKELNTSINKNKKQKNRRLKKVKEPKIRKARNVLEDAKAGGIATDPQESGLDGSKKEDPKPFAVESDDINFRDYFLPKDQTVV
ncbi:hypothetical protein MKW94_023789 [Papaver nudicaule]|uniref:Uncharacterized protein n=1 Tax=Papaver nudicaule TaxID=74823 RepID=A0AA41W1I9_PAPNU|nr:hypothetical protein [Papaver nudicaule]